MIQDGLEQSHKNLLYLKLRKNPEPCNKLKLNFYIIVVQVVAPEQTLPNESDLTERSTKQIRNCDFSSVVIIELSQQEQFATHKLKDINYSCLEYTKCNHLITFEEKIVTKWVKPDDTNNIFTNIKNVK